MDYLLDTNICIYFMRGNRKIVSMFNKIGIEHLYISEMTVGELYYGAECSDQCAENSKVVESFCNGINILSISNIWKEFAKQKCHLRQHGQIIEDADIIIGATAIVNHMIIVTENTKHLGRLKNVNTINWNE